MKLSPREYTKVIDDDYFETTTNRTVIHPSTPVTRAMILFLGNLLLNWGEFCICLLNERRGFKVYYIVLAYHLRDMQHCLHDRLIALPM